MRSFLGFGQVQYIGAPSVNPVKLAGIAATLIPLTFNWLSYGASTARPNINVLVDCRGQACVKLDYIRSVYIDNLGSNQPIYVFFPDTSTTIVCKPNSEGWFPAFTNQKTVYVIAEGFLTGDVGSTFITLCNVPISPGVNVELDQVIGLQKASPVITRGSSIYNSTFGVPALGDQFFASQNLSLSVNGSIVPLWNTPHPSGFLYVTMLVTNVQGALNSSPGLILQYSYTVESTGIAGTLFNSSNFAFPIGANSIPPIAPPLPLVGMQLKLDATQSWRARTTAICEFGSVQFLSSFTVSDR